MKSNMDKKTQLRRRTADGPNRKERIKERIYGNYYTGSCQRHYGYPYMGGYPSLEMFEECTGLYQSEEDFDLQCSDLVGDDGMPVVDLTLLAQSTKKTQLRRHTADGPNRKERIKERIYGNSYTGSCQRHYGYPYMGGYPSLEMFEECTGLYQSEEDFDLQCSDLVGDDGMPVVDLTLLAQSTKKTQLRRHTADGPNRKERIKERIYGNSYTGSCQRHYGYPYMGGYPSLEMFEECTGLYQSEEDFDLQCSDLVGDDGMPVVDLTLLAQSTEDCSSGFYAPVTPVGDLDSFVPNLASSTGIFTSPIGSGENFGGIFSTTFDQNTMQIVM